MKFEFWMWIAIFIVSLLARVINKRKNAPPKPRNRPNPDIDEGNTFDKKETAPSESQNRPNLEMDEIKTFEDLLRKIEQAKQPSAPRKDPPIFRDYETFQTERPILHREEEVNFPPKRGYIEDVGEVKRAKTGSRDTVAEVLSAQEEPSLQEEKVLAGQEEDRNNQSKSSFLKDLFNTPDDLKKAVLLTEIIHRKY